MMLVFHNFFYNRKSSCDFEKVQNYCNREVIYSEELDQSNLSSAAYN